MARCTSTSTPTSAATRPGVELVRRTTTIDPGGRRAASLPEAARPQPANGAAGAVIIVGGRPFALMGFIVAEGRILEIDAIADPRRVVRIAAPVLRASDEDP